MNNYLARGQSAQSSQQSPRPSSDHLHSGHALCEMVPWWLCHHRRSGIQSATKTTCESTEYFLPEFHQIYVHIFNLLN